MKWLLKYNFEPCIEILKSYFRIDKSNVFNGTSNLYCSGLVCSASLAAWTPPTSSRSSPSSTRTGSISFRKILKQSCNVQSNTAFPLFLCSYIKKQLNENFMIFPAGWQSGRGWCVFLDSRLLNLHTGAHPGSDSKIKIVLLHFSI